MGRHKGTKPWNGVFFIALLIFGTSCEPAAERYLAAAETRMDQGDYLGAAQEYERVVLEYPNEKAAGEAYYWIGVLNYLYLDDPRTSLEAFLQVVEHFPTHGFFPSALFYMGELYERKFQDRESALATYQRLIGLSQPHAFLEDARLRVAEIYFEEGELDQARTEWEAFVRRHPDHTGVPGILYRIAGTYFLQARYEEAIDHYRELIGNFPQSDFRLEAQFRIGNCLEETQQFGEALQVYEALLEDYPNREILELRIQGIRDRNRKESFLPSRFLDKTRVLG